MTRTTGVTVISDPQLNVELERVRALWYRHSGRKGNRKDVAEALIREAIEARRALGWFDNPDVVDGLVDPEEVPAAHPGAHPHPGAGAAA